MTRPMMILKCITVYFTVAASLLAAEVNFVAAPKVTTDGERVKITFELSAPTDVAVGIVNKNGVVVRHLAAGLLGSAARVVVMVSSVPTGSEVMP